MNVLKSVLFGIIEGITEWLPISSTAHLKILNEIVKLDVTAEFYTLFEVVIQLGAAVALIIVLWKKIWPFGKSKNPLGGSILSYVKKDKFFLWLKIFISCLPAIIYELFLEDIISFVTEDNELIIISLALIIVGAVFIIVEVLIKNKKPIIENTKDVTFMNAAIIGLSQLVAALFPGVSRSGATIVASLLMGISRSTATEYTFELAIPVMFGASLMRVIGFNSLPTFNEALILLVGCTVAFIVSLFVIRFTLSYIKKNSFTIFGIYRILLGIAIIVLIL